MSYILDALRKADAERDRGSVPGIHAQPNFGALPAGGAPDAQRPWLWLVAGALAMTLLGALGWWFFAGSARDPAVAGTVSPAPANAVPGPVPLAVQSPSPTPTAPPARSMPITDTPPTPAVVNAAPPPARKPKPVPPATTADAADAARAAPTTPAAPLPTPAAMPGAASAAAASTADRVYAMTELPDEIRRQLPPVNVGGSMYSSTAANRLLIINGQVLHEGDKIGPELVLQQIRIRSAVLAFRGYRYAIGF